MENVYEQDHMAPNEYFCVLDEDFFFMEDAVLSVARKNEVIYVKYLESLLHNLSSVGPLTIIFSSHNFFL